MSSRPTVLMVAEKPSIADAIANALGRGNKDTFKRGSTPIHEFTAQFRGQNAFIKVTSVTGHVYSTDFPREFQSWGAVEPEELFGAPIFRKVESQGVERQLRSEGKNVDYLVLWLDCDREGENICFEVMDIVCPNMKRMPENHQQVYRAHFSAITPSDIQKAMGNLGEPNFHESEAVNARQELDLKVGVAFSRFQTMFFQNKYGDLDSSVLSYGPCQTPTLFFTVDRYDDITSFSPERFWRIKLGVRVEGSGREIFFNWGRKQVFDMEVCSCLMRTMRRRAGAGDENDNGDEEEERKGGGGGDKRSKNNNSGTMRALVTHVRKKNTKQSRPLPLNTVEYLKTASKRLGIGPHQAMRVAEHLYLSGYISYPRTESTAYPDSMDLRGLVDSLGFHVEEYNNPRPGVDMGDHPPITPVARFHGDGEEGAVYHLICTNLLASISPDARFENTHVTAVLGDEVFTLHSKRLISPGFLVHFGHGGYEEEGEDDYGEEEKGFGDDDDDATIVQSIEVDWEEGMEVEVTSCRLDEGQTKPPSLLSEAELIGKMERNGIGTDASIATHIQNICNRNYVSLERGRRLSPTTLGIVLIHGYLLIDPDLVFPQVRSAIEKVLSFPINNFFGMRFNYFIHFKI